jgi:hypothetical protein
MIRAATVAYPKKGTGAIAAQTPDAGWLHTETAHIGARRGCLFLLRPVAFALWCLQINSVATRAGETFSNLLHVANLLTSPAALFYAPVVKAAHKFVHAHKWSPKY